ncbi:MAG: DUF4294 domain-containing protein [Flavobacteriaceae bacterium]|nr:DUF4294 domain-containing protein [Flavobacteriaceae bacterium]
MKIVTVVCCVCLSLVGKSQIIVTQAMVVDGDTVPHIELPRFIFIGKLTPAERRERLVLLARIRTVMPYAKMTAFRLQMMEQNLQQMGSKKEKKAYIKLTETHLKKEFTESLKNLSVEQGKLLVKLISRETGNTVFDLMGDYSGGTERFFWNTFSSFWGYELDVQYDLVEDYRIELAIRQLGIQ